MRERSMLRGFSKALLSQYWRCSAAMFRALKEQSSPNSDESSPKQPIARPTTRPLFGPVGAPNERSLERTGPSTPVGVPEWC